MVKRTDQREKFDREKKADVEAGRGGRGKAGARGGGGRGRGRGGRGKKPATKQNSEESEDDGGADSPMGGAARTVRYSPAGEGIEEAKPKSKLAAKAKPKNKAVPKVKAKAQGKAKAAPKAAGKRKPGRPKKSEQGSGYFYCSESEKELQSPPAKRAKKAPKPIEVEPEQDSHVRKTFAGRRRGQGEDARARFDAIAKVFFEHVAPTFSCPSKFEVLPSCLYVF